MVLIRSENCEELFVLARSPLISIGLIVSSIGSFALDFTHFSSNYKHIVGLCKSGNSGTQLAIGNLTKHVIGLFMLCIRFLNPVLELTLVVLISSLLVIHELIEAQTTILILVGLLEVLQIEHLSL